MPELPEVEVTRLGLVNYISHQDIRQCYIYNDQLRWPVPPKLKRLLNDKTILDLKRRGKYLLLQLSEIESTILIHLGMSGHLRLLSQWQPPAKHTHIDLQLKSQMVLRYTDPRRFGCWLLATPPINQHPLLKHLGPEPLSNDFNSDYLYQITRRRRIAIKSLIMQQPIVVGIGNIYASEALFHAGVRPSRNSNNLNKNDCLLLVKAIKSTLQKAIEVGGTSLKDFFSADGKPGYFSLSLAVYNRQGEYCFNCQTKLEQTSINQRQSVFCPRCQI